jgi:unspecific monooxygenase
VLLNAGPRGERDTLGNGMLAFARIRTSAAGRRREVEPATAGEEMIRYDPPLQLFERWVLADDFAIADQPIPRGDKVALLFGSANRDPRVFRPSRPVSMRAARTRCSTSASAAESMSASGRRWRGRAGGEPRRPAPLLAGLSRWGSEPRRTGAFVIWGLQGLELSRS